MSARTSLLERGMRLEALTITWNVIEAVVAIGAGLVAGSVALVGFGLDSTIETIAAIALYVRLRTELRGAPEEESEAHEARALRVVGVTFFALAAYIVYEAGSTLWFREAPEPSRIGIGIAALSLLVMPFLAWAKHRTGVALGSRALIADAKETIACSYLSLALLLGLGLNALFGLWWADPVAALAMLPWVVREGWEALEESKADCGQATYVREVDS
jgi:divalent metal cation (Fe/Co/Zn/Cd) transporter